METPVSFEYSLHNIDDFYMNPESRQLFEKNNTVLQCVTGYAAPPAEVYWEKDGSIFLQGTQEIARFGTARDDIAIQQSMILQFSAELKYNGTYRCVARNPLNNITKTSTKAYVKIQAPMRSPYVIEALPAELLLTEGVPHLLNCPMSGWPLPHISWYQAGILVSDTDRKHSLQNGSLYFDPALREDSGRYYCIGSNVLGSVPSTSVNISVAYLDLTFIQQPHDTNAIAGQQTLLQCQPPEGYPKVTIVWYKGTIPIRMRLSPYALSVDEHHNLIFDNVQMEDGGVYYCVAYNEFALPKTSPQLDQPPTDAIVVRGDLLTLSCKVKGYPRPAIAWYKDSDLVLPDTRIIIRDFGQELLISDVNILDEGHYRFPPEVTVTMKDLSAPEGADVEFTCGYYGDPIPTVTWFKERPTFVSYPQSKTINVSQSVIFYCEATGDPQPTVSWKIN
ncbi:hypothetical protein LSH36_194g05020, partial [Paralvinella palmiformis]